MASPFWHSHFCVPPKDIVASFDSFYFNDLGSFSEKFDSDIDISSVVDSDVLLSDNDAIIGLGYWKTTTHRLPSPSSRSCLAILLIVASSVVNFTLSLFISSGFLVVVKHILGFCFIEQF